MMIAGVVFVMIEDVQNKTKIIKEINEELYWLQKMNDLIKQRLQICKNKSEELKRSEHNEH